MHESTSFTTTNETTMKRKGPSNMAERIALIRAGESRRPEDERICYDPYAIRFINPKILEFIRSDPEKSRAETKRYDRFLPGTINSVVTRVQVF